MSNSIMEKADQTKDQLKLQKTRSIHDAELLINGAEFEKNDDGKISMIISDTQREAALQEMDKELNQAEIINRASKIKEALKALVGVFNSNEREKINQCFSALIPLVCVGGKNIMNIPYQNMFRFISLWIDGKITPIVKTKKIPLANVLANDNTENSLDLVEIFDSISAPYSQCFEVEYQGASHCINCIIEKRDRNYPHNNELSQVERNLLRDLGLSN